MKIDCIGCIIVGVKQNLNIMWSNIKNAYLSVIYLHIYLVDFVIYKIQIKIVSFLHQIDVFIFWQQTVKVRWIDQ